MTEYTEREVRDMIAGECLRDDEIIDAMLTQLADMLAEREKAEPGSEELVWKNPAPHAAAPSSPSHTRHSTHPAAQPRVVDGYVMVPLNDDNWPPLQVVRAMLDCQDADPADGTESEGYYGLRAAIKEWADMRAAQPIGADPAIQTHAGESVDRNKRAAQPKVPDGYFIGGPHASAMVYDMADAENVIAALAKRTGDDEDDYTVTSLATQESGR